MAFVRVSIFLLLLGPLFAWAQAYVPGEVIVKMKSSAGSQAGRSLTARMRVSRGMKLKNHFSGLRMYHFSFDANQRVDDAIKELKNDPDVEYAEPNYLLSKASTSSAQNIMSAEQVRATTATTQYYATGNDIGLNQVNQQATGSGFVGQLANRPIVAVIDTGVDINHYVMTGTNAIWTNAGEIPGNGIDDDGNGFVDDVHGWNFISNSGTMLDDDGHGTHVAGIVLSVDQNIFGMTLQTSRIQIMPLKFLDGNGSGSTSNAIKAIYYAVQNGAVVLNNSWGGADYSSALNEAIAYSYNAGTVFAAAAGNSGTNDDVMPLYPANYDVPNIISVAAITDSDNLASFSNYGQNSVGLGSPGVFILSTLPGNMFGQMSGTSMATPFVSGTAGLMKMNAPAMLGYQIRSLIYSQTVTKPSLVKKVLTNGKLNSANAVTAAGSTPVNGTQPTYTMSYADRSLASNLSGGGCGTVTKMDDKGGPPNQGMDAIGVTLALVLLPMIYLLFRRMKNPANRRRFERFQIHSDVRIHVGDKELVGSISSISLGGARVDTSALLQDGGLVSLTIESPNGSEKVEVTGRVVWSEANKSYGVAFDDAPESVLGRISNWTKVLQRAS